MAMRHTITKSSSPGQPDAQKAILAFGRADALAITAGTLLHSPWGVPGAPGRTPLPCVQHRTRIFHASMASLRRLDQILSSLGYCSRKEVWELIDDERILIGEELAKNAGEKVDPSKVRVDDELLDHPEGLLLLLNKPLGLVCSHDGREGPAIYDLLPARWRRRNPGVTSVGRLDKETSGLILLTDQTQLVHRLTSPKHKVPKTYVATLERDVAKAELPGLIARFASGTLQLEDEKEPCAPALLSFRDARTAELVLTEGRYHQVRRMFVTCGYTVTKLNRERFGDLTLGELPPGQWRELPLDQFGKV